MNSRRYWKILLFFALTATPHLAAAQQCTSSAQNQNTAVSQAISSWEQQSRIILTDDARTATLVGFCSAAANVQRTVGATPGEISAALPDVITEFLTDNASDAVMTPALEDVLVAQISLGSTAALPGPRALGRVRISYSHTIDTLIAGGRQMPPYPAILSGFGRLALAGTLQGHRVCSGAVTVVPSATANFTC